MVRTILFLIVALSLPCAPAFAGPPARSSGAAAEVRAAFVEMMRAADAYGNAIDALQEEASTFCISERAETAVAAAIDTARASILEGAAMIAALAPGAGTSSPSATDYAVAAADLRDRARQLVEGADMLGQIGDEISEVPDDEALPGACRAQGA